MTGADGAGPTLVVAVVPRHRISMAIPVKLNPLTRAFRDWELEPRASHGLRPTPQQRTVSEDSADVDEGTKVLSDEVRSDAVHAMPVTHSRKET